MNEPRFMLLLSTPTTAGTMDPKNPDVQWLISKQLIGEYSPGKYDRTYAGGTVIALALQAAQTVIKGDD